jgi:hypothetical protein
MLDAESFDESLIPASLLQIVALIGLEAALKLVKAYGGVRLYVPKKIDADHPLVELIGYPAARALAAEFGGQPHFDIPKCEAALREARNRQIRQDRAMGHSIRELALKYRLTERGIEKILGAGLLRDERQAELFEF